MKKKLEEKKMEIDEVEVEEIRPLSEKEAAIVGGGGQSAGTVVNQ